MKARLRFALALGFICLLGGFALFVGFPSVLAINGFSPNQELPLPLLAPIGPAPLAFIVRGLEPSVRVDQEGTVYVSSIRGVPGGVDLHRYFQPTDCPANNCSNTYPFKYEGQPDNCGIFNASQGGCANNSLDPLGLGLGGGDVDIAVNYPTSGIPNLALVSLTLAPGITGTHSTDRGDSFSAPNPVVALIPVDDRQWIEGFAGQNVYLNYHDIETFNIEVQRSNDGGQTYVDGFGEAIDPQTILIAGGVPPTNTANVAGQIKVDRSQCPSNGNLYQIFVAPDNVTENLAGGPFRSVYVGVSTDVKLGLQVFTFTDNKVFTGPVGSNAENIFPALAVDDFGFVYAVWSDNSNVFYSFSTDQGTTWSNPINVSFPINGGHANVFPWVAADANGHVGIVWFGDDRAGNSNDRATLEPCPSNQSTTCMTGWANWNVYFAESLNAHDPLGPTFVQSQISDHFIHRGTVSTGGLGGGANRNLADLFQIAFDPQHRANVAFSDDHKLSPVTVSGHTDNDDPQARRLIRANFTHQLMPTGGIVTTGTCAVSPPLPPDEDQGQGEDNEQDDFSFVDRQQPENGAMVYHDRARGLSVRSSNGVRSVSYSSNCVNFIGNAKVNGQSGYPFTFVACDLSALGTGIGTFSISLVGPGGFSYQKSGTMTKGFVRLHAR